MPFLFLSHTGSQFDAKRLLPGTKVPLEDLTINQMSECLLEQTTVYSTGAICQFI